VDRPRSSRTCTPSEPAARVELWPRPWTLGFGEGRRPGRGSRLAFQGAPVPSRTLRTGFGGCRGRVSLRPSPTRAERLRRGCGRGPRLGATTEARAVRCRVTVAAERLGWQLCRGPLPHGVLQDFEMACCSRCSRCSRCCSRNTVSVVPEPSLRDGTGNSRRQLDGMAKLGNNRTPPLAAADGLPQMSVLWPELPHRGALGFESVDGCE
jgi:hypothetical protein